MQKKKRTRIVLWLMVVLFAVATVALIFDIAYSTAYFPFVIPFIVIPVMVILVILTKMSKIKAIITYSMIAVFVIALTALPFILRVFDENIDWDLFLILFVIPFMIAPVIITAILLVISVILAADRQFKRLTNRLENINQKLKTCAPAAREKLTKEKQSVEQELAKFWSCEYCRAKNHNTTLRCHACGANLK